MREIHLSLYIYLATYLSVLIWCAYITHLLHFINHSLRREDKMPRRKIREYQAKKLLSSNITSYFPLNLKCAQVTPGTDFSKLLDANQWLDSERLVVKPDMLFGKRGKNNLVLLNATYPEAQKFIEERINKSITIGMYIWCHTILDTTSNSFWDVSYSLYIPNIISCRFVHVSFSVIQILLFSCSISFTFSVWGFLMSPK